MDDRDSLAAGDLARSFAGLRAAADGDPNPTHAQRDRWLAALETMLGEHTEALIAAIAADFGHRSAHETRLLEVLPSLEAIRFARRHLRQWMEPDPRRVARGFLPGSAHVRREPLGVVGIVVPWNYPLYLALGPLVGALAAGNRVLIKLSELVPATARLMQVLLDAAFGADELRTVLGDADVGRAFARLPFDHLLFTGSTAVGREIMRAAAENLTPVTLELGGKSPAIVADGYPLAHAAERIVLGKCLNAGQTCIAPDYALVPAASVVDFLQEAARAAASLYPDPLDGADYTAIVNDRHYARLSAWLAQAQAAGARVVPLLPGCDPDPRSRRLPPVAVVGAPEDCALMQEEIFGPVLPVVAYGALEEAIRYVARRPHPLALYCFDHDAARIERVLREVKAGGVTVNDVLYQIAQEDLPFGGLGPSGVGRYHGREGFLTFTNAKAVLHQSRWAPATLVRPPFAGAIDRLIRSLTTARR
jgi:acyl-CoA reductase-like NAD-dependent aldehyde dehydrogenase